VVWARYSVLRAWMRSASSATVGPKEGLPVGRPREVPSRLTRRFTRRGYAAARRSDTGAARLQPDVDANRREADGLRLPGFLPSDVPGVNGRCPAQAGDR
jgi:hypothetical protein